MDTKNFKNLEEFSQFVKQVAVKIIKEEKTIENLGDPTELKMNKNAETKTHNDGAKVSINDKGTFKKKAGAPVDVPKEFEATKDPTEVKMEEKDGGSDEDWATAAAVKGTDSKKPGTKNFSDGLAKPDVTSKTANPKVSDDADPTKKGGIPGDKDNKTEMNKEDKEDKQTTPKTQVLGKGEMSKEGFSKGQTDQEINVNAKQEKDDKKEKLDAQIKTIQLPESFKNKKELIEFIDREAKKLSKIL
jgi:hypothetical protein